MPSSPSKKRSPPRSTRVATLLPDSARLRSDEAAHINDAQIDSGEAVEPPRQRVEAVTLKEAQRIGLICRVRQEQRHHAVQAIDVIDPLLGRQPIQGLDAVTKRREAPANSRQMNGVPLFR